MAPAFKVAADATPVDVRSVQTMSRVGRQRSTGGGGACQEKEVKGILVRPSVGGQKPSTMADAVPVATSDLVGSDMLAKVEEMNEKLKTENLSLRDELVAERTAHTRALMNKYVFNGTGRGL